MPIRFHPDTVSIAEWSKTRLPRLHARRRRRESPARTCPLPVGPHLRTDRRGQPEGQSGTRLFKRPGGRRHRCLAACAGPGRKPMATGSQLPRAARQSGKFRPSQHSKRDAVEQWVLPICTGSSFPGCPQGQTGTARGTRPECDMVLARGRDARVISISTARTSGRNHCMHIYCIYNIMHTGPQDAPSGARCLPRGSWEAGAFAGKKQSNSNKNGGGSRHRRSFASGP